MYCMIYERACKRPLFEDFKKDFIEKCKIMADRINELDFYQPILRSNLLRVMRLLKKMNAEETNYVEKVLNNREKEIEYVKKYGGQTFSFDYNMSKQLQHELKRTSLEKLLFEFTNGSESLSAPDVDPRVLFPYSANYENKYFTKRRRTDITMKIQWFSSFYHPICGDPVFVAEYLSIKESQVSYLQERGYLTTSLPRKCSVCIILRPIYYVVKVVFSAYMVHA